ncbi:hypothetical protein [Nocardiopsis algeriensis]|uniref:Multidrug efflux pump subunit AcrA (Membrane-fusion protein) n=1 Tax=Nocardiopsis algeriensis TaxID=1478215 RepID=A0A841IKI5_9ACTN|nr:hypothetical protein [Nocardiopsis algeriensis]MBB6118582.1 multidrug efflux pump subunit AcrA (membrane-fusion protein) [Nocardiopsis algeriensis]
MRWLWTWLLVAVAVVLGGAWVLFRFAVDLNELSQLSGVGSLATGVAALVVAVWTLYRPPGGKPDPSEAVRTVNTVNGDVSGPVVQAGTIENGVHIARYGGDHVDPSDRAVPDPGTGNRVDRRGRGGTAEP